MMNNSFLNKIKEFFHKIFFKNEIKRIEASEDESIVNNANSNFKDDLLVNTNVNDKNLECSKIANQIFNDEIDCYDLTDEQADDMIEYFNYDIKEKQKELERIKNNIIKMKNSNSFSTNS